MQTCSYVLVTVQLTTSIGGVEALIYHDVTSAIVTGMQSV